jgi:hypothetical protein
MVAKLEVDVGLLEVLDLDDVSRRTILLQIPFPALTNIGAG